MLRRFSRIKRALAGEDGFSLIELMVVVIIIGILVSIAGVSFAFTLTRARETVCESNRKVLEGALNEYATKDGSYPQTLDELYPDYIESQKSFFCPKTGNPYVYETNENQTSYTLTCPDCGE